MNVRSRNDSPLNASVHGRNNSNGREVRLLEIAFVINELPFEWWQNFDCVRAKLQPYINFVTVVSNLNFTVTNLPPISIFLYLFAPPTKISLITVCAVFKGQDRKPAYKLFFLSEFCGNISEV